VEMCVLVELGLHNPLAAEIGLKGGGEWALSSKLLDRLPQSVRRTRKFGQGRAKLSWCGGARERDR